MSGSLRSRHGIENVVAVAQRLGVRPLTAGVF